MSAPAFGTTMYVIQTDAGGAWSFSGSATAGQFIIVHILQDGSTAGAVALTSVSGASDLAGNPSALTYIGAFAVGEPTAAYQHIWCGRAAGGVMAYGGTNSTSEDLYMHGYTFDNVSAGTTLATVIENGTAGAASNGVGTSATASDTAVTTLGPDRLALNLVAVNDDNNIAQFSGMSGGTWALSGLGAESSGTDGALALMTAAMASAGTIDGGTGSITDSDAWGVVGFALIGTTVAAKAPPFRHAPFHLLRR